MATKKPAVFDMARLKKLEEDMGVSRFTTIPDGIYHMTIKSEECAVDEDKQGAPRLRLQHRVVCGEQENRTFSTFFGWFPSEDTKSDKTPEQRAKITRSILARALGDLAPATNEASLVDSIDAYMALAELQDSGTEDYAEVAEAFDRIIAALDGTTVYATVKTGKQKEGQ